jgi:exopolyphosphatase / guanosine-5'-triphosphate,3'-diphosphate pyrophosphatase
MNCPEFTKKKCSGLLEPANKRLNYSQNFSRNAEVEKDLHFSDGINLEKASHLELLQNDWYTMLAGLSSLMTKNSIKAFVLDIGSASVRLLIGSINNRGSIDILHTSGCVTGFITTMGKSDGRVCSDACSDVLRATAKLLRATDAELPGTGAVLCTQATRQLSDNEWLLAGLQDLTGLYPEVLSSFREGQLALKGSKDLMDDNDILIDLGGGSTEIVFSNGRFDPYVLSFPVGAGVMRQSYRGQRTRASDNFAVQKHAADCYWAQALKSCRFTNGNKCVVIGGTATTLTSVYYGHQPYVPGALHGIKMTLPELRLTTLGLAGLTSSQRSVVRGLEKGREPIIVTGGCLLLSLCEIAGVDCIVISERGIRYGRLYELLQADF